MLKDIAACVVDDGKIEVSVLYREPKLLKVQLIDALAMAVERFSALP